MLYHDIIRLEEFSVSICGTYDRIGWVQTEGKEPRAMINKDILKTAEEMGFCTAIIDPTEIPVNPEYLKYCEDNVCGNYEGNYACPPDCGTPEEMHQKLLSGKLALVLQSQWEIPDYGTSEVLAAKAKHNASIRKLRETLSQSGENVFAVGYGGCTICNPCRRKENKPCAFPELKVSCMSAYCIDAAELAKKCNLPFEWNPQKLHLFGMMVFI